MLIGFLAQIVNIYVLHQQRIRRCILLVELFSTQLRLYSITYTNYLRSLSLIYLCTSPLILISIASKGGVLPHTVPYVLLFYFAHIERYAINVLLFSGNLLVARREKQSF